MGFSKVVHKYKSISRLGKFFIWLSIALAVAFIVIYITKVQDALAMDPNSYNCLHDSMMKQRCNYPYETSLVWAMIALFVPGLPFVLTWVVVGIVLLLRPKIR